MEIRGWRLNPKTIVIDRLIAGIETVFGMDVIIQFGGIAINKDDTLWILVRSLVR